jgi:carboxypeptidase C (cathepsin A)
MSDLSTRLRCAALAALLAIAGCSGGGGGGTTSTPPPPPASAFTDPVVYSSAAGASLASAAEITAVTRHQLAMGGATLSYTATAGHMSALGLVDGTPQASFFYVAYTLDGASPSTRPVTFFYNGGPGSSSVWLHLGSFGPKRLATGIPATNVPAPFALVDNTESLLDVSDLVFVDAVGSGYSQAIAPHRNDSFWGVDADAAVFRDFVMRYVSMNTRQASPKFLFGESYGGPRTAVLADLLESAGVALSGIVLQSPAMDYNSNCGITTTSTVPCGGYLPSYGASGAWHQRATPSPPPGQLAPYMEQMRALATGQYEPAVLAARQAGVPPAAPLLGQLAATTGMPESRWQANFNMGPTYYRVNLMPGTLLGRYDTRIVAPDFSFNGEVDPSSNLITGSFVFRIGDYLANTLGYTTPSTYVTLSNAIQTWNFSHDGRPLPDTIPDLAAALAQNPTMQVLAVNGYHDVATPFFTTERDLARLGALPNVQVRNYPGGHMTYLDDASRVAMKADLAQFYGSALAN